MKTFSEAFSRLGKLLPVYGKALVVVILHVRDGVLTVQGISKRHAFGFGGKLKDSVSDFSFYCAPDALSQALNLNVTNVKLNGTKLEITGSVGSDDSSPVIKVFCNPVMDSLMKQMVDLEKATQAYIAAGTSEYNMCAVADVLQPWLTLAKCGNKRIYLTKDLTYALGQSSNAFYAHEDTYKNIILRKGTEPPQVDTSFPAELAAVVSVCGAEDMQLYSLVEPMDVFFAKTEDGLTYALACAAVVQAGSYARAQKKYDEVIEFPTVTLLQSAVRDVLLTASDELLVKVESTDSELSFTSGALGKIKADVDSEFDCACAIDRAAGVLVLNALPFESELSLGFGETGGTPHIMVSTAGIVTIIPAHDITEV